MRVGPHLLALGATETLVILELTIEWTFDREGTRARPTFNPDTMFTAMQAALVTTLCMVNHLFIIIPSYQTHDRPKVLTCQRVRLSQARTQHIEIKYCMR